MKCFVVADVHSFYDEMIFALNKKGFDKNNSNHVFISLGDLLDRGPKPKECLKFVLSLKRKILIKGNHEDLLEEAINRGCFLSHDVHNGTFDSAQILTDIKYSNNPNNQENIIEDLKHNKLWNEYKKQLIDYAETDKYVFVHGWVPEGEDWRVGNWENARWLNGMYYNSIGENPTEKTVFCGHWHASWGNSKLHHKGPEWDDDSEFYERLYGVKLPKAKFTTFKDKGIRALDACTVYSGFVNCETVSISKKQLEKYIGI